MEKPWRSHCRQAHCTIPAIRCDRQATVLTEQCNAAAIRLFSEIGKYFNFIPFVGIWSVSRYAYGLLEQFQVVFLNRLSAAIHVNLMKKIDNK